MYGKELPLVQNSIANADNLQASNSSWHCPSEKNSQQQCATPGALIEFNQFENDRLSAAFEIGLTGDMRESERCT